MLNRLHDLLRLRTSPSIFFGAAAIIVLFVIATVTFTETMDTVFSAASEWLYTNLGWFYIFGVTLFLIFLLYLVVSRYGRVKLGPDDEPPEHSGITWFAMLFAAGIGSILMFCLGIIGEYIGKTYLEVKHRPRYTIEKILMEIMDSEIQIRSFQPTLLY